MELVFSRPSCLITKFHFSFPPLFFFSWFMAANVIIWMRVYAGRFIINIISLLLDGQAVITPHQSPSVNGLATFQNDRGLSNIYAIVGSSFQCYFPSSELVLFLLDKQNWHSYEFHHKQILSQRNKYLIHFSVSWNP